MTLPRRKNDTTITFKKSLFSRFRSAMKSTFSWLFKGISRLFSKTKEPVQQKIIEVVKQPILNKITEQTQLDETDQQIEMEINAACTKEQERNFKSQLRSNNVIIESLCKNGIMAIAAGETKTTRLTRSASARQVRPNIMKTIDNSNQVLNTTLNKVQVRKPKSFMEALLNTNQYPTSIIDRELNTKKMGS